MTGQKKTPKNTQGDYGGFGLHVFEHMPLYSPEAPNPADSLSLGQIGVCPSAWLQNRVNYITQKWRMNVFATDLEEKLLIEGELQRRVEDKHRQST